MGPYDYTSAFANLPPPGAAFTQGMQTGLNLQALQEKRQQERAAVAQKAQMQADLAELSKNPTPQAIASMMVKYPGLSEDLKRGAEVSDKAQQQARLDHGSQVYAAVLNGQPDVAKRLLTERATALRNSGNEREAAAAEAFATMVSDHPELAKTTIGIRLAGEMGADKFTEAFKGFGAEHRAGELQSDLVRKGKADADGAQADAETKSVTAKYADSQALADLERKRWDVKKIVADIEFQKESNRIAAMNAAANKEGNALKREELRLKVEEARTARDDKIREKVAKAESGANAMDNMLNTVDRLLKNGSLDDVLGSIEGRMPAVVSDEAADAIALIDTLGSQAFLSQVPTVQGMGALSNAEGEKLQSALQNLSRTQSEAQFKANLGEVKRLVKKGRDNVSKRYGVPLGSPDTPASNTERPPLSSFQR